MNFIHPHFAEPQWLWLATLGPLALLALQWYSARMRSKQLAQMAAPHFLEQLTASRSPLRRAIKNALVILAVSGAGLALARPQWGEQKESGQMLGEDIVFVMDCSRSMLASDVAPNRLQRAKLAIIDFVHRRGNSRVGLVAFAGQAFLQCPITFDYGAFEEALNALDEKTIPIPGTDIGGGLDEGFRALEKGERDKLLVVLTDGEDLEKGGVKMAEGLAKKGVIIFTIGVGTPAGSEIQVINEQGKAELLKDSKGEVVRSRLDETTLKSIARVTKGAYFPLGPLGEGLAKVRVAMQTRSRTSGWTPSRKLGVDRFHVFIAGLLVLLVMESVIGTRRRSNIPTTAGHR
jgi:Ca-activated chloride channel family protein